MTYRDVLLQFMLYCQEHYGKELAFRYWNEFCDINDIPLFTQRAIEAAFSDPELRDETLLFAHNIGELARETA